nr:dTDP-glucose 4,6-dehydratase [Candidatus Freyarchaeota archaeon]
MRVMITGGAGFIGSNFVRYMLEKYDYELVVLDKLTYAGRLENLQDVLEGIEFIKGDICVREDIERAGRCDVIFNFAAETHVDRSIMDAGLFIRTDILGTHNLLEYSRRTDAALVQISTDEVYGSIEKDSFKEADPLDPSSPYSASKASADMLVRAYYKTYDLPVIITRSSNNFGPFQYPEKLVPLFIINALLDRPLPLYGDGGNIRDWIYVQDNCEAIELAFQKGKRGEIYNIGGGNEKTNLEITHLILESLKKPKSLIQFVKDRKGHDWRYSLDCSKIRKLGWKPRHDFETVLKATINWYRENEWWWRPLIQSPT